MGTKTVAFWYPGSRFEIAHVAYTADDTPVEVCLHVMPGHLWTLRYSWRDQADSRLP